MTDIHISQMISPYEGTCTYYNDLMYHLPEQHLTAPECRDYLDRKIKQLDAKIENGKGSQVTMRGWRSRRMVYKSILNYLNLHKIK